MRTTTPVLLIGAIAWLLLGCQVADNTKQAVNSVSRHIASQTHSRSWLLVDQRTDTLSVMVGVKPLKVFDNVAFGRNGVGHKRKEGDGITPLGTYHIRWVNPNSRFKLFFGLDYPTAQQARQAFAQGRISRADYQAIVHADQTHGIPPQKTPLGGEIGIHGVGHANGRAHLEKDWTQGCIALTDQQIDELANYIHMGMKVVIR